MDDRPVDRAFADRDAFESDEESYVAASTPFEAEAEAVRRANRWRLRVQVTVPTLDAAVAGEDVGDAVANGWFETLSLRLEDAYDVIRSNGATEPPTTERDEDAGEIRVQFAFETTDPRRGVDDAAAIVDFVEGTYVQGVIPGYEYDGPVGQLVRRARRAGGDPTVERE
jgi:hypothetical protein